jgi:hypothetical protein
MIELKYGQNSGLGVIGETLFYTMLLHDTCVAEDSLFEFGRYRKTKLPSDAIAIRNNDTKFKPLISHILAEKYHPLFNSAVESIISDGLKTLNIGFDRAMYSYEKKEFVDANNDL